MAGEADDSGASLGPHHGWKIKVSVKWHRAEAAVNRTYFVFPPAGRALAQQLVTQAIYNVDAVDSLAILHVGPLVDQVEQVGAGSIYE